MGAPNAPIPPDTVELPGPARPARPRSSQPWIAQSVYMPMIPAAAGISNGQRPLAGANWHDGTMKIHALVAYSPATHTDLVLKAIGDAGAGRLGNYSHCSFVSPGTGRFTPLPGASPFIGQAGTAEEVAEDRIECVVEEGLLGAVVAALRAAHPYEEPAFMTWPVEGWR